ncbi:MAG: LruC domain-containing protein [bacterium]|nr:LruC domain-containing protein [bacterium]
MKTTILFTLTASLLLGSCKKSLENKLEDLQSSGQAELVKAEKMTDIKVPANFDWKTTAKQDISIKILDNQDLPVASQKVWISTVNGNRIGTTLITGFTNANGEFKVSAEIATTLKQILVNTTYLAVPKNVLLNLSNTKNLTLGGKSPASIQTLDEGYHTTQASLGKSGNKFAVVPSNRTWNSIGVPTYLEPTNDVISTTLLNQINSALPSGVPVSSNSPLLDPTKTRVIRLIDSAEVFVTFVSEGAGYLNSLFYYTYNVNNPPASLNDIQNYKIIFANTSFNGSGGGLVSGNKVRLGNFPAGTVIAYGLAADGYKGGSQGFNGVTEGNWLVFGDKNLNPESSASLKEHLILMQDPSNQRLIMGFEDIRRDNGACDHDFNDALFYTTANPYAAIDNSNIPPLPSSCTDTDADGVCDVDDCEPTNANVATCNTYGTGTLAFEDLWPSKGDYDMNDVVITYNYTVKANASNKVTRVEASYTLRATGGSFQNGFGIQFPVDRSKVSNVTGATLEANQSKAVLVLFNNMRSEMNQWNTVKGGATSATVTYNVSFNIANGPTLAEFGLSYYNPFIWNNTSGFGRGYEIHLPGGMPTDLANPALFGTVSDNTNIGMNRTYVSKDGSFPWGLHIPATFNYPKEKADINSAYLKFGNWVTSGGSLNTDWYTNGSGNRNTENIY